MLVYKERNTFLQGLHPLTTVLLICFYLIVFLVLNNPIYLCAAVIAILLLSYLDGCLRELLVYGKLILPFALLIMILNPLMVHNGDTIIYAGKINYPVLGPMRITLEAVLYGIFSGIKAICITIVFGFGNLIIHPDRAFGFFSKYIKKSALLMSMTIRLFPTMMSSYSNIIEVEKLRGNRLANKSIKRSMVNGSNIVNILFLSSLEDASDMAESMYSRGYGANKRRSTYFKEKFRAVDYIMIFVIVLGAIYLKYIQAMGYNELKFYPKVDNPIAALSLQGAILCGIVFIPFFINWGWKSWK